jgi:hypothetical protein
MAPEPTSSILVDLVGSSLYGNQLLFHHLVVSWVIHGARAPVAIIIWSALYSVTLLFSSVTSSFFPGFSFPTPITSILFFHQELNSFAHGCDCSTLHTAGKSLSNDETVNP